jgi:hypothetical protein
VIIVQDPNEAEFDGMPQSAIAAGIVDMILPVAEIPPAILKYSQTAPRSGNGPRPTGSQDNSIRSQWYSGSCEPGPTAISAVYRSVEKVTWVQSD